MSAIIRHTLFNPLITGSLLYVFTRGPPEAKEKALQAVASLPINVDVSTVVTTLKWLVGYGCLRVFNKVLDRWAYNNWSFSNGGRPWEWNKEVCVITGGSGGLGAITTRELVKKGVTVAIVDIAPPSAELLKTGKVHFYKCDITSSESVNQTATQIKKDLGTVSILINNAGIGKTALITETTDAQLDKIFKINLISHWYTVREFLPDMIKAKKGHVVSIASMASYTTVAGMVDYCVTKAGALTFSEGLSQELKWRHNAPFIQVTSINPYWVKTPLIADWVEKKLSNLGAPVQDPEVVGKRIAKAVLSGRGSHVLLPEHSPVMLLASMGRGLPHWVNELGNDSQKTTAVSH